MKIEGIIPSTFTKGKESNSMRLIDEILRDENLKEAINRVKINKGAPSIDKMTVEEIDEYFNLYKEEIKQSIFERNINLSQSKECIYLRQTVRKDRWEYRR